MADSAPDNVTNLPFLRSNSMETLLRGRASSNLGSGGFDMSGGSPIAFSKIRRRLSIDSRMINHMKIEENDEVFEVNE